MNVYHVAQIYTYDMWSLAEMFDKILSSLSYMEKNQGVKALMKDTRFEAILKGMIRNVRKAHMKQK